MVRMRRRRSQQTTAPAADARDEPKRKVDTKSFNERSNHWVSMWIKFIIVQVDLCYILMRQCSRNSGGLHLATIRTPLQRLKAATETSCGPSHGHYLETKFRWPLSKLLKLHKLVRIHYFISICAYIFYVSKYLFIELLRRGSLFQDGQYLDCLLLGRFRFVGRTNAISGEILVIFLAHFLAYRLIFCHLVPKFKFYSLEFLLHDYDHVLIHEIELETITQDLTKLQHTQGKPVDDDDGGGVGQGKSLNRHLRRLESAERTKYLSTLTDEVQEHELIKRSVFYVRSPFNPTRDEWILRPNRTTSSWLELTRQTRNVLLLSLATFISWILIIGLTVGGSLLTNLGFELSYPSCVTWLRERQHYHSCVPCEPTISTTSGASWSGCSAGPTSSNNCTHFYNFSSIYVTPKVLAHELPIETIPAVIPIDNVQLVTWYSLIRTLADVLENCFIYMEFMAYFTSQFYLAWINSYDIALNAHGIKLRLIKLIGTLRDQQPLQQHLQQQQQQPHRHHHQQQQQQWQLSSQLAHEINQVQVLLSDHFQMVKGYNRYMSFFTLSFFSCWLMGTIVICRWMGEVRSRAAETEFCMAELGGTVLALALISSAANIRSTNNQLYPLIMQAMALDPSIAILKSRWMTIAKYYFPKSLYCFTILGFTEISWLLCLKIVSWVLSAFVVLASFFYMNR